jgi:hypothetical protein
MKEIVLLYRPFVRQTSLTNFIDHCALPAPIILILTKLLTLIESYAIFILLKLYLNRLSFFVDEGYSVTILTLRGTGLGKI